MKRRSTAILLFVASAIIATGYALTTAQEARRRPELATAVANPSNLKPRSDGISTQQYRLKHISALDAAKKINAALPENQNSLQVEGVVARGSLVVVPIEVTNSLTAVASGKNHERLTNLIAELDAIPTEVLIRCSLSRVSADGTRDIISRPQVRTVDGQEATIQISQPGGGFLEFSVTPHTARPDAANVGSTSRIGL